MIHIPTAIYLVPDKYHALKEALIALALEIPIPRAELEVFIERASTGYIKEAAHRLCQLGANPETIRSTITLLAG